MLGCPTYIGRIGRMVPTPCIQEIGTSNEQRVVFGGGEGTLSPRRVRLQGAGGRTWDMSRDHWSPHENSALYSLARRQALYGGSYRVIPCDAVEHNMFTPRASEELWDWTGLSVGPAESFPTVAPGEAVGAMMMGRVTLLGNAATSPRVPTVNRNRLYGQVYVAGTGRLSLLSYGTSGGSFAPVVTEFAVPSSGLTRVTVSRTLTATHASAELQIEATAESPVYFAWPSMAHADNPYVTGRGCDKAYLSMPDRTATTDGAEGFSYQIVEVGA